MRYRSLPLLVALVSALPGSPSVSRGGEPTEAEIGEVRVYLTPDQAVREIFEGVARVDTLRASLSAGDRAALASRLGGPASEGEALVLIPRAADGTGLGFATIAEEAGKYRPITFLVGTTPDLHVRGVEVLVYRESRGGEIRHRRFLRQYHGKTATDPIRANRDILNIAGATISVNSMNLGVKRALLTLELLAARGEL